MVSRMLKWFDMVGEAGQSYEMDVFVAATLLLSLERVVDEK
jgi:hypothetical protein